MKKIFFLVFCSLFTLNTLSAQLIVSVAPTPLLPFTMLQIESPATAPKGVLLARMSTTQRDLITAAPNSLLIFNTDSGAFNYYTGSKWQVIADTNKVKAMLDLKVMSLKNLIDLAEQNAKIYTDSKVLYLNGRIDSIKTKQTNLTNTLNATNTNFNNFVTNTLPTIQNNITSINTNIGTLNGNVNTLQNNTIPNLQSQMNGFYSTNGNVVSSGAKFGHINNEPLIFIQNNQEIAKFYENSTIFIGLESGLNNNPTSSNIGIGKLSLKNASLSGSSIGIGGAALLNCQNCFSDLAIGSDAMSYSSSLWFNVAVGRGALQNSTVGKTTAIGNLAGINTKGFGNVFIGSQTKSTIPNINNSFVIGSEGEVGCSDCGVLGTANTKVGIGTSTPTEKLEVVGGKTKVDSLLLAKGIINTTNNTDLTFFRGNSRVGLLGDKNIVLGLNSFSSNTTGVDNIAIGKEALFTVNASGNIGIGKSALAIFSGDNNIGIGSNTLYGSNGTLNIALGPNAGSYSNGNKNTYVGNYARGSTSIIENSTAIGNDAFVDAPNKIRLGDNGITSISYAVSASVSSDIRLKKNILDNLLGLSFIKKIPTKTYEYIYEGQKGIRYTGIIAQDAIKAAEKCGVRDWSGIDKSGEFLAVRYETITVPLIKATQELDDKVIAQQKEIDQLKKENEATKKEMAELRKMILEMKK